jgi:predicted metal-binding membrane protein
MTGGVQTAPSSADVGLRPAFDAARTHVGLVVGLFALAALGWRWTAGQMSGMDAGPWTALGTFGWFIGVWVVMMAAMMFPSVAPTVALYARMKEGSRWMPVAFTAGYLVTWAGAGVVAYVIGRVVTGAAGDVLDWVNAGRPLAGVTLLVAGVYELTPLKNVCLGKCRSPLGFLMGSWREGWSGALRMGMKNGAWCVGCCWALMAALFALGVMSIFWMAVVAGLIAVEKLLPWRRAATYAVAGLLLALGLVVLFAPDAMPGLTVPNDDPMPMAPMSI